MVGDPGQKTLGSAFLRAMVDTSQGSSEPSQEFWPT